LGFACSSQTVKAIFKVCDSNKDGDIDRKEFLQCLERVKKTEKNPDPDFKCPEIVKILDLFSGGSLKQWNCLGKFIEVNGAKPSAGDYRTGAGQAEDVDAFKADENRARSPTMSPGCNQQ